MKKFEKYGIKRCHSMSISNEEMKKIFKEKPCSAFHYIFKEIESFGVNVFTILASDEMEGFFKDNFGLEFYDARHLWTAHVRVVKDLKHVIFIGKESDEDDFIYEVEVR